MNERKRLKNISQFCNWISTKLSRFLFTGLIGHVCLCLIVCVCVCTCVCNCTLTCLFVLVIIALCFVKFYLKLTHIFSSFNYLFISSHCHECNYLSIDFACLFVGLWCNTVLLNLIFSVLCRQPAQDTFAICTFMCFIESREFVV